MRLLTRPKFPCPKHQRQFPIAFQYCGKIPSTPRSVRTAIDLPSRGPILACNSGPADSVSAYLLGLTFRTNHSELHTTKLVRDSLSHNERSQPQRVDTSMEGAPRRLRRFSVPENVVSSEVLLGSHGFGASTSMTPMPAQIPGNTTLGLSMGVNESFFPFPNFGSPNGDLTSPLLG